MATKLILVKLCCLAILFSELTVRAETRVGDRLILEIGRISYPQSYLEAYMYIRYLISSHLKNLGQVPQFPTWTQALEEFKSEMIISREAKKLGRFYPTQDRLQAIIPLVEAKMVTDQDFSKLIQRLGLERQLIIKITAEILQVYDFKRHKRRTQENSWFQILEKNYIVRFFFGAEKHVLIQPKVDLNPSSQNTHNFMAPPVNAGSDSEGAAPTEVPANN